MEEKRYLENFICDNSELVILEQKFEKFNIFDCLKLTRAEIRHSNFLGWLLDPQETHGLNDYFLKEFIKKVLYSNKNSISNLPSVFDIDVWNMSDIEVRREYKYIDLLIIDENNKFIILIENKIDTNQHDNQLQRYIDTVRQEYPDEEYKKLYVYLKPDFEKVAPPFIYVSYKVILETINSLIEYRQDKISNEILIAIKHYKEIIERDIMKEDDIKKICRTIYNKHRKAIDLIYKYNFDASTEIMNIFKEIIGMQCAENDSTNFLPKGLKNRTMLNYGKEEILENCIGFLQIEKVKDKFNFCISIQPSKTDTKTQERDRLISSLKEKLKEKYPDIKFNNNKAGNWSWVSKEIISIDEYNNFEDINEFKKEIEKRIQETGYIDIFRDVINNLTPTTVP